MSDRSVWDHRCEECGEPYPENECSLEDDRCPDCRAEHEARSPREAIEHQIRADNSLIFQLHIRGWGDSDWNDGLQNATITVVLVAGVAYLAVLFTTGEPIPGPGWLWMIVLVLSTIAYALRWVNKNQEHRSKELTKLYHLRESRYLGLVRQLEDELEDRERHNDE